jgi:hypothetical protein
MEDASLLHRCRDAILASPFEATVTAHGMGPLKQHARETCLQPTRLPGRVYLRCECCLDVAEGVLLMVRLRDQFTLNGPIPVSAACSWHRDEDSVAHNAMTELGAIDNAKPLLLTTVKPANLGISVLPGSHFYLHVYFDLASSALPSATGAPPTTLAAIEEEKRKLQVLQSAAGQELLAHICKPLSLPHCRNLEFVYRVARERHEALCKAREHDKAFELEASCDYLQSGLVDRLCGPHFAQRRQDLSTELASLRSQHSPTKPPRCARGDGAPSWRPSKGETVLYRDDQGQERSVVVTSVLDEAGTTKFEICWERQTERRKLFHCDGRPLKAEEVRSLRPGYDLVYNGYDVSVLRVLMEADNADDDGVPRLEIKIVRITTKVSRLPSAD